MSRALDAATMAALAEGDPQAAYDAVADVLSCPLDASPPPRLELEILGRENMHLLPPGAHYLRDGVAVAFSKLSLVLAFCAARTLLADGDRSSHETMRASAVLLMMDPEHLTAANARKRVLAGGMTALAVARELWLVDSLLTGHLHRHTKSPTLWNHRRWLLAQAPGAVDVDVHAHLADVVFVAGERHPRNYYAWDHARWLVGAADPDRVDWPVLATAVRDWCFRHHADTSGWSFLLWLFERGAAPAADTVVQVVQVARMAASLRWTGEAVWVFLRTAVARQAGLGDLASADAFRAAASSLQAVVAPGSHEHRVLQQAVAWRAV